MSPIKQGTLPICSSTKVTFNLHVTYLLKTSIYGVQSTNITSKVCPFVVYLYIFKLKYTFGQQQQLRRSSESIIINSEVRLLSSDSYAEDVDPFEVSTKPQQNFNQYGSWNFECTFRLICWESQAFLLTNRKILGTVDAALDGCQNIPSSSSSVLIPPCK